MKSYPKVIQQSLPGHGIALFAFRPEGSPEVPNLQASGRDSPINPTCF